MKFKIKIICGLVFLVVGAYTVSTKGLGYAIASVEKAYDECNELYEKAKEKRKQKENRNN